MEIGIDSFAGKQQPDVTDAAADSQSLRELIDKIVHAEQAGLDVFGIGEHHRREYLDSAPPVIIAAAAARTSRIRLTSAVTVLSAADPVRVFQQFATIDLISGGRAEIVAGRGSFIDAYPLFGLNLNDYDELFAEKLDLLLKIRDSERVTWRGRFRPALSDQPIYPRPLQNPLPIWRGVGGTPESFVATGLAGLPLMVAVIGGQTDRFRPLVDLYRRAYTEAGHSPEGMKVGLHSLGYVADTTEQAVAEFFPGYKAAFDEIGKERGFPPVTRAGFEAQAGPRGALVVGSPEEVAAKIKRHAGALGGISRFTFMMDVARMPQDKVLHAISLIGARVKPLVNAAT